MDVHDEQDHQGNEIDEEKREEKVNSRTERTIEPIQPTMKANAFGNVFIPVEQRRQGEDQRTQPTEEHGQIRMLIETTSTNVQLIDSTVSNQ